MISDQHNKINSYFGLRYLYSTYGMHLCPFMTVDYKVYSVLNQDFEATHDYFQRGFDLIAMNVSDCYELY